MKNRKEPCCGAQNYKAQWRCFIYWFLRRITRKLYKIKGVGLGRLCEFIRKAAGRYPPAFPLQIQDFQGSSKFFCYLDDHMGGQIFFRGSYSGDQLALLKRLLKPHMIFIDGGANQGEFTVAAARLVLSGTVVAIEPMPAMRVRLEDNIHVNGLKNVIIIPSALGGADAMMPIYDNNGLFTDGTRHEGLWTLFPRSDCHVRCEEVPVRRLDDILRELKIDKIDVLKLDIEGGELAALHGAEQTILTSRPIVLLEVNQLTSNAAGYEAKDLLDWLINHGYRIEQIEYEGLTKPIEGLKDFQNIVAYPAEIKLT